MMGTMTIQAPSTVQDQLTREPVGTGPYKFTSWRPGQDVVLTRFDGYWGEKPEVEKATYIWRTESAVRAAMVATGEADIAPSISAPGRHRPCDGLQLLRFGDHQLPDRRRPAAARRRARAQGAEPTPSTARPSAARS